MSFIPGARVVAGGKVVGAKRKKQRILYNETITQIHTTIIPYSMMSVERPLLLKYYLKRDLKIKGRNFMAV